MSHDNNTNRGQLFTQIDVGHTSCTDPTPTPPGEMLQMEIVRLLREMLSAQDRQNELLEEMISQFGAPQKQRAEELTHWKKANPKLAGSCRQAAESLGKVQAEFLNSLTEEVSDSFENLIDGEFMFQEFVDRFGPRMAHLNGILQVLSQLSSPPGGMPPR